MNVPMWAIASASAWAKWMEYEHGLTPGGAAVALGQELWREVARGEDTSVTRIVGAPSQLA